MTVLKLKLPTDKERKEQHDHRAYAYGELEQTICEARNRMTIAFRQAMDNGPDLTKATEEEYQEADLCMFTLTQAWQSVEKLYKEYYSAFPRPALKQRA
jgi:hypothetical protein